MSDPNEAIIKSLSLGIFSKMMDDLLLDISQRAHKEVYRSRAVCKICHTRCRSVHASSTTSSVPPLSTSTGDLIGPSGDPPTLPSRPSTPFSAVPTKLSAPASGTTTPNSKDKSDVFFDCLNCKRSIASNRYAPHLASCLGIGTSTRRNGARNIAAKPRLGAEGSRSNSPQVGVLDDPPPPPVKKGRPPKNSTPKNSKKKGAHSATPEVANGTKRPASPLPTPPKNAKKMKAGTASPSLSSKGLPPSVPSAQSLQKPSSLVKVPSRLRATSTSSHAMAISPSASVIANAMDVDYDAGAVSQSSSHSRSPTQRSQSGTPDSFMRNGVSSGMSAKTVPGKTLPTGYLPPRPAMPMSVTAHNDPDYLAVDADDMVDTDTDDNDDGEDD